MTISPGQRTRKFILGAPVHDEAITSCYPDIFKVLMSHSTSGKVRYLPEHYFLAPVYISLASLSPSSRFLALSRGHCVSIHPVPTRRRVSNVHEKSSTHNDNDAGLSVYMQDGHCDATALAWLTDDVFVTGYIDGTVVFTQITVGEVSRTTCFHEMATHFSLQRRVRGHSVGVRASDSPVRAFLKDRKALMIAVATEESVQLWKISRSIVPTYQSHVKGISDTQFLSWSSQAHNS